MNSRSITTALTAVSLTLAAGEAVASIVIWREAYADSAPLLVLAFALPFLIAAGLVRSGRVVAGAVITGVLCAFQLVTYPGLVRHNTFDWIFQSAFAVLSITGLVLAVAAVVATRRSSAGVAGR
ncbi:MAG: hypothetical protein QOJ68_782 [Blastococcus sp.]|nr:hypothetical protein [Blastococcus sp.]